MIVFGADQKRDGGLVEASALAIPLLDAVQRALPRQIEHEEDGHCVIADERQHVDELSLSTKIPNRECDLCVADGDGLFHKIDALTGQLAPLTWGQNCLT